MPLDAVELCAIYDAYVSEASTFRNTWDEAGKLVYPREKYVQTRQEQGSPDNALLLEMAMKRANEVFASGITQGTTPSGQKWFNLRSVNLADNEEIQDYYDNARDVLLSLFTATRFYTFQHSLNLDLGAFGISHLMPEPTAGSAIPFKFTKFPVGSFVIDVDEFQFPDTCAAIMCLTPINFTKYFNRDTDQIPKDVSDILGDPKRSRQDHIDYIYMAMPNPEGAGTPAEQQFDPTKRPYLGYYVYPKTKQIIRIDGYYERPSATPRFNVSFSNKEKYGRSPGTDYLHKFRMANRRRYTFETAIEKMVDPPILTSADSLLQYDVAPAGITIYDPTKADGVPPQYWNQSDIRMDVGFEWHKEDLAEIRDLFFNDMFTPIHALPDKQRTLGELGKREIEKIRLFSPGFTNILTEGIDPIIERTYNIADRAGLFGQKPALLEKAIADGAGEFEVKVESQLALMIRQTENEHILMAAESAAVFQQLVPGVIDNTDWDSMYRKYMRNLGQGKDLKTKEEVKRIREANQQMQNAMEQAEIGKMAADGLSKLPPEQQQKLLQAV